MQINILEKVLINDSNQWLLVRGNSDRPLILQVQAGPGLPMISEANTLQKLLHLEDDFLVAYWDQRACGKSFDKTENPANINLDQLADDVISCTQHLLQKYNKKTANLIGYSIGATISLLAGLKTPHLFSHIFSVGTDIHVPSADIYMMEFIVGKAENEKNRKWLKEINQLRAMEITNAKSFQKRAKLLSNTGGIISNKKYNDILFGTLKNMFFTKEYTLADIIKTVNGMEFCQNALLPDFSKLNLFEKGKTIGTPVHFLQGMNDAVAPVEIARSYFEFLKCPSKTFVEFKHSAHMPHLEEPNKFADVIRTTLDKPRHANAILSNSTK